MWLCLYFKLVKQVMLVKVHGTEKKFVRCLLCSNAYSSLFLIIYFSNSLCSPWVISSILISSPNTCKAKYNWNLYSQWTFLWSVCTHTCGLIHIHAQTHTSLHWMSYKYVKLHRTYRSIHYFLLKCSASFILFLIIQ